jgi:hypothetical protein
MTNDLKDVKADEPINDPTPPAGLLRKAALAWAAWSIRKKNRAAQQNGGQRVPL